MMNASSDTAGSTREVFASCYEEYMPRVYRYIHYRVSDIPLAEDLTSAVFVKALNGFKRYRADRASFFTWLMTIARNIVIDHYREQSRRKNVPLEEAKEIADGAETPEQEAVHQEELRRLRHCVAGLSPQEQEIISCKFGAEMNNRQIAGLINLSDSNVGTMLFRAVRKLRDCFRKWLNG